MEIKNIDEKVKQLLKYKALEYLQFIVENSKEPTSDLVQEEIDAINVLINIAIYCIEESIKRGD